MATTTTAPIALSGVGARHVAGEPRMPHLSLVAVERWSQKHTRAAAEPIVSSSSSANHRSSRELIERRNSIERRPSADYRLGQEDRSNEASALGGKDE